MRLFLLTHRGARLLHCAFLPLLLVGCAASGYPSKPGVHQRYDRTRLEPLQHRPQRMPLGAPAAGVAAIDGAQRVDMTGRAARLRVATGSCCHWLTVKSWRSCPGRETLG